MAGPLALLAGALAVVLVFGAVHPVFENATRPVVEHTTAEVTGEVAPVPGSVEEVAWTWEPDDELVVLGVAPGGPGAVLDLLDGVLALDTETGEEVWRYRRPGVHVRSGLTSGGGTVALSYPLPRPEGDRGDPEAEFLLLDAATGAITDEHTITAVGTGDGSSRDYEEYSIRVHAGAGGEVDTGDRPLAGVSAHRVDDHQLVPPLKDLTEDRLVSLDPYPSDDSVFSAAAADHADGLVRELPSLEKVWEYTAEQEDEDCISDEYGRGDHRALAGDLLLVSMICERAGEDHDDPDIDLAVVALDVDTGEERWRYSWEPEGEVTESAMLRVSGPVHSAVSQRRGLDTLRYLEPRVSGGLWEAPAPRVAVSRTDEWYDGMVVLDLENGDVVTEDPLDEIEEPEDGEPRDRSRPNPAEPVGLDDDSFYLRLRDPDHPDTWGYTLHRMELAGSAEPQRSVEISDLSGSCAVLAEAFACVQGTRFDPDEEHREPRIETVGFAGGERRIDIEPLLDSEPGLELDDLRDLRLEPVPGALLVMPDGLFDSAHPDDFARQAEHIARGDREHSPDQPPIIALR